MPLDVSWCYLICVGHVVHSHGGAWSRSPGQCSSSHPFRGSRAISGRRRSCGQHRTADRGSTYHRQTRRLERAPDRVSDPTPVRAQVLDCGDRFGGGRRPDASRRRRTTRPSPHNAAVAAQRGRPLLLPTSTALLTKEGLISWNRGQLLARVSIPPLPDRHLQGMPPSLRREHRQAIANLRTAIGA